MTAGGGPGLEAGTCDMIDIGSKVVELDPRAKASSKTDIGFISAGPGASSGLGSGGKLNASAEEKHARNTRLGANEGLAKVADSGADKKPGLAKPAGVLEICGGLWH